MEKDYFLLEDKVKEVKSNFLLKNGWLKIYENEAISDDDYSRLYCCLISKNQLSKFNVDDNWPLEMGYEGKPVVYDSNIFAAVGQPQNYLTHPKKHIRRGPVFDPPTNN